MLGIIDKWYEHPGRDYPRRYELGQMYWAPVPFMLNSRALRRFRADYILEPFDLGKFDPRREAPSRDLGTRSDEFVLAVKFKIRPVIIISRAVTPYQLYRRTSEPFFLAAPLHTVRQEETAEYKFPPKFILQAQAYQYATVFYLPEDQEFNVQESIIFFDHISAIHQSLLTRPKPAKLTQEAHRALVMWLSYYLGGRLHKDLDAYRQLAQEELPKRFKELGLD